MNIITIAVDDMNAFATFKALYPGVLHTPNIDRLMAEGVTFQNAFAQVALCNPSRTSILTGKDPALTGVHYNTQTWSDHVRPEDTIPAMIKAAGFDTAIFGKIFHSPLTNLSPDDMAVICDHFSIARDYWVVRAGDDDDSEVTGLPAFGPLDITPDQHGDYINTTSAIDYLEAVPADHPFSLYLGIFKPHTSWMVPQEYFDLYPLDQIELPFYRAGDREDMPAFVNEVMSSAAQESVLAQDQWPEVLQAYFASMSFADAQVGRLLEGVEATGHSQDTAIVLWSDHGYHLGDKDTWHKFTLWEESGRAPLIIKVPGTQNAGQVVTQPVQLVDIGPTMLDLLDVPASHEMSGRSLLPFLEQPSLVDDGVAITTMFGSASIRTNEMRYIMYQDGSEELYDIAVDPNSWTNLASDANYLLAKTSLQIELQTKLGNDGWQWVSSDYGQPSGQTNTMVLLPGAKGAVGGPGDDSYFLSASDVTIAEEPGGGYDTVYASGSFVLPPNIEFLQLSRSLVPADLTGNDSDNRIVGFGHLRGMGGDDDIQVITNSTVEGGDGDDHIDGSGGNDTLDGGLGNDVLIGTHGNDHLSGGPGDDSLNGGPGEDWIDYSSSPVSIAVDLFEKSVKSGGETDTVVAVEHVVGSNFDDVYSLSAADNRVKVLLGNDEVDGRDGADTVILPVAPSAVKIVTHPAKTTFVYEFGGVTYRVSTRRVEMVEFADGSSQLIEKVEHPAPPLANLDQ